MLHDCEMVITILNMSWRLMVYIEYAIILSLLMQSVLEGVY